MLEGAEPTPDDAASKETPAGSNPFDQFDDIDQGARVAAAKAALIASVKEKHHTEPGEANPFDVYNEYGYCKYDDNGKLKTGAAAHSNQGYGSDPKTYECLYDKDGHRRK
ncbi:MAG: hypothetical protein IPG64_23300 [Haliea sp.]|nr:hypothetical protein [Haliea sp.]